MEDLQIKYDSLCYYIFNAVRNLSHGADSINLKNFDGRNEEHLLVLAVTDACAGVLGNKVVTIDGPIGIRRRLAAKYKKSIKIKKNQDGYEQIDVPVILDGLRGWACELCGPAFTFKDIYDAYYREKER